MAYQITIPRLGWSMEEGTFCEWLKVEGDFVQAGDAIFVLEGEKASQDIEAVDAGYLHIPVDSPRPGKTVKVGQVIGYLLAEGEAPPTTHNQENRGIATKLSKSPSPPQAPQSGSSRPVGPAARRLARLLGVDLNEVSTPDPTGRIISQDMYGATGRFESILNSNKTSQGAISNKTRLTATPRARHRAAELGVELTQVIGTGRNGRIRERDVLKFSPPQGQSASQIHKLVEPTPAAAGTHTPASNLRKVIAKRMHLAVSQAAPVTLITKIDATPLVAYREQLKRDERKELSPSYTDILVWLVAQALKKEPAINACWYQDGIHHYDEVHIAVAVDTPRGLLTPVIRNADQLSVAQIAEESQQLISFARQGLLNSQQLAGATFSISNLGMIGIDAFTPILNLPQAGILGIGRIVREPVVRGDEIQVGQTITLSLTFDHRVVDGAPAARWLQNLCGLVSQLATSTR